MVYRYWDNRPVTFHPNLLNRAITDSYDTYFRTNSLGFNDVEHNVLSNSKIKILLLGDSYIEAVGVNPKKHIARNLEMLAKKNQKEIEVISMGMSGWGTAHQLATYMRIGKKFEPDIVISFFCTNDLHDNNKNQNTWQSDPPQRIYSIKNNNLILNLQKNETVLTSKETILRTLNKLETYHIFRYLYSRFHFLFLTPKEDIEINNLITASVQNEKDLTIDDWASKDDFDFFYLLLDKMKEEIVVKDESKLINVIVSGGINETMDPSYFEFLYKIEEAFKLRGIKTINFDTLFRINYKKTGVLPHWEKDAHWNENGHQMVSEIIYNELLK